MKYIHWCKEDECIEINIKEKFSCPFCNTDMDSIGFIDNREG